MGKSKNYEDFVAQEYVELSVGFTVDENVDMTQVAVEFARFTAAMTKYAGVRPVINRRRPNTKG